MAEFCAQCAETLFGLGIPSDFQGDPEITLKEGEGFLFLCEGCGPTIVNHAGVCIANCYEDHGKEQSKL